LPDKSRPLPPALRTWNYEWHPDVAASVRKQLKIRLNKHEYLSGMPIYIEKLCRCIMHNFKMKNIDIFYNDCI